MGLFDKLKKALTKTREGEDFQQPPEETLENQEAVAEEPEQPEQQEAVEEIAPEFVVDQKNFEPEPEPDEKPVVYQEKPRRKSGPFGLGSIFKMFRRVDEELLEELEESMIFADVGFETTEEMLDELRERIKDENIKDVDATKQALKKIMVERLSRCRPVEDRYPMVILMVGVNGVGKTTTIGKLAHLFMEEGRSVTIAAADTFRAAAVEQLQEWGRRSGAHVIKHSEEGADPSAVVFDAIASAKAKGTDILIVDTAGRLHNKKNLMDELNKIKRTIDKNYPEAGVQTFLALDATTGQNGVNQAEVFTQTADVDAVCLNKLDGSAKGGVVFSICDKTGIGVKYVGVGESIDDIVAFDATEFVDAIIG